MPGRKDAMSPDGNALSTGGDAVSAGNNSLSAPGNPLSAPGDGVSGCRDPMPGCRDAVSGWDCMSAAMRNGSTWEELRLTSQIKCDETPGRHEVGGSPYGGRNERNQRLVGRSLGRVAVAVRSAAVVVVVGRTVACVAVAWRSAACTDGTKRGTPADLPAIVARSKAYSIS